MIRNDVYCVEERVRPPHERRCEEVSGTGNVSAVPQRAPFVTHVLPDHADEGGVDASIELWAKFA
jgi:hypothetical protein